MVGERKVLDGAKTESLKMVLTACRPGQWQFRPLYTGGLGRDTGRQLMSRRRSLGPEV
jgi:hypothetical protein